MFSTSEGCRESFRETTPGPWDFVGGRQGIGDREHLPYTHFSLFRDAIRNSQAVADMTIQAPDGSAASKDLESVALVGKNRAYVLLINRHGNEPTAERP